MDRLGADIGYLVRNGALAVSSPCASETQLPYRLYHSCPDLSRLPRIYQTLRTVLGVCDWSTGAVYGSCLGSGQDGGRAVRTGAALCDRPANLHAWCRAALLFGCYLGGAVTGGESQGDDRPGLPPGFSGQEGSVLRKWQQWFQSLHRQALHHLFTSRPVSQRFDPACWIIISESAPSNCLLGTSLDGQLASCRGWRGVSACKTHAVGGDDSVVHTSPSWHPVAETRSRTEQPVRDRC